MALQKPITKQVYGESINFSGAYHQVNAIAGNKDILEVQVLIYKDDTKNIVLSSKNYTFTPNKNDIATRWDKQAYEYLKTLDEYADAVDC